jgi:multicomponent K+:H+ antiporter subunit A
VANLLFLVVLAPFVGAALIAALPRTWRRTALATAGMVAIAGCAQLAVLGADVFAGGVPATSVPWLPASGVDLGLRLDGYACLFALLIHGIGALVLLYAGYYLGADDPVPRFCASLLLFMGAMLGLVLADNLILLVAFWELTSLASFLLIGYWNRLPEARDGARLALAVTGAGGLALLAGVLLLGGIVGSFELDAVLAAGDRIRAHAWYTPALLLVLAGVFTKSAQFPLHFWLPNAMTAPTPVSAYLHSATMVKAGVFLLGRLHPALAGTETWFHVVSAVGLATLVTGAWLALFQHDLKGLLAYSTISHLGLVTLLFGLDTPLATVAAVFHVLNHAIFKASLFMAVGIIDHETGTRDMRRLNGLWRHMPVTATLAMVSCAGMAGVPLANGFLSKEMFFAETLFVDGHVAMEAVVPAFATLAGVFSVAYSLRFIHDVFFNGEPVGLERTPHEPPRWMRLPVEVLVLLCLAVGMLPALTVGPLLSLAAAPVLGGTLPEFELAIWHGFNTPLLMSLVALLGGVVLYAWLQHRVNLHTVVHPPRSGRALYEWGMRQLERVGACVVGRLATERQPVELRWLLACALAALAVPMLVGGISTGPVRGTPANFAVLAVWLIGITGAVGTVRYHAQRLVALVFLGVTGLAVSLAFVHFSAPDLALTQLLVEVVGIVLMMLALNYLPQRSPPVRWDAQATLHAGIAIAVGIAIGAVVWSVLTHPAQSIAGYYLEQSVPAGGGTNVVNVIIVDFRAFDTLGEITVLAVAALLVHAVLAGAPSLPQPGPPANGPRASLILTLAVQALLPLAALVAVHLLLRGHNLPGGGFIAGLVLATAFILQYVARGQAEVEALWRPRYQRWIGGGLLLATLTGAGSLAFGYPFLTSGSWKPELPVIGVVPIASAMFFDIGVFLVVVGATLLALSEIGRLRGQPGTPA